MLYMNKADFLRRFHKYTLDEMKKRHCLMVQLDHISNKINNHYAERKMQARAVLDAAKVNPVNLYGERKFSHDSQQLGRLKPWLKNA